VHHHHHAQSLQPPLLSFLVEAAKDKWQVATILGATISDVFRASKPWNTHCELQKMPILKAESRMNCSFYHHHHFQSLQPPLLSFPIEAAKDKWQVSPFQVSL
jgi:hypothetical protein